LKDWWDFVPASKKDRVKKRTLLGILKKNSATTPPEHGEERGGNSKVQGGILSILGGRVQAPEKKSSETEKESSGFFWVTVLKGRRKIG